MFCNNLLEFRVFLSVLDFLMFAFSVRRRQGSAPRIPQPLLGCPNHQDVTKG